MRLSESAEEVKLLKEELDKLRPIDKATLQRINQKFRLEWNYNSNHLEGNSLTYGETKNLLLHNVTANGKPLKDHEEIKGHNEAIKLMEEVIRQERPITQEFIRELHKLLLVERYQKKAENEDGQITTRWIEVGQYKKTDNHIRTSTGEIFYFTPAIEVDSKMTDMIDWYRAELESNTEAYLLAAEFHYRFIRIHPFDDGNGRTARMLMNFILMGGGYPPVVIKSEKKDEYYKALRSADAGDIEVFFAYIVEGLIESLKLMIKGAKGEDLVELDDFDKELFLLKSELQTTEELPELSSEILSDCLDPIIDIVFGIRQKAIDLKEFYKASTLVFQYGERMSEFDLSLGKSELKATLVSSQSRSFRFIAEYQSFKRNPVLNGYNFALMATFEKEWYTIQNKRYFYNQIINGPEIDDFIISVTKPALEHLKGLMGKKKWLKPKPKDL